MLDDVRRRTIRLPGSGHETALLDWGGDGPLALLHHANGFCAALWDPVARHLRNHFRVVAMDARGHGDSSPPSRSEDLGWSTLADDVVSVARHLLEETGEKSLGLGLGHSFGGTLTLAASARSETLYERILLVDPVIIPAQGAGIDLPPGGGNDLADRARRRRQLWASREEARAFLAPKALFESWQPGSLDLYVSEALRQRTDGQVELKCAGSTEAAIFEGSPTLDIFAEASHVTTPTRLLWARGGEFPRFVYEALVTRMGQADVADIDGGHLVPMEAPERVAQVALRFTRETSDRRATG